MAPIQAAGVEPGRRRLNGPQTTGRQYRDLSPVGYGMRSEDDVEIPVRDGTVLLADVRRPATDGAFPVLISVAPYPRQMQDLGAPAGVVEAGASDFWAPRGYGHVVANVRGTAGSGGTFGFFDAQERRDLHDLVEWVAAQPWCDGNVGMFGISYYAMAQLAAATQRPPHLKALFAFDVTVDAWEAAYHNGVFSKGFITQWVGALGVLAGHSGRVFRSGPARLARRILAIPALHRRFAGIGGEDAIRGLRLVNRFRQAEHPWSELWRAIAVEHRTRDGWWAERDLTPLLADVDIPVYLGSEWTNVPMHLSGTFTAWDGLAANPRVRMSILGEHGLPWPWESMHVEALAWYDHWLKGRDTGILDGPDVRYWLPGAEQWRTSATWPPPARHAELALDPDGGLAETEREGERRYEFIAPANPRARGTRGDLPDRLVWTSTALTADLDVVGHPELRLTATTTADDIAWIALLEDVAPDGTATPLTQGWLRAALREVDEAASTPGRPVLPLRTPVPVRAGERVDYRIPLVATARRFAAGHRIRLTLTSDDTGKDSPAMLLFEHAPIGPGGVIAVHSSSRLLLPVLV